MNASFSRRLRDLNWGFGLNRQNYSPDLNSSVQISSFDNICQSFVNRKLSY